ncbi:hypothetical protein [Actinoplanes sp. URMC 104]|uniref:hypothetical protein n=1 Tax=Actinoplanes sp. URMC 104 TaxID=3423409 RepID=UPI003F1B9360
MRALPLALVAVAVTATAACDRGDDPVDAAAPPSATGTPDTGFGGSPATSPPATGAPAEVTTVTVTPPTARSTPTRTKSTPSKAPARKPGGWAAFVKPCPYEGQKAEIQGVVEQDVTEDGLAETLVTRSCEASTSYWHSTIEVFDGASDPAQPRRIGTLLEDVAKMDEPVVQKVTFNKGIVGVRAYGTSAKGEKACPDLTLFYRYEYTGSGFKRIWRDAGAAPECGSGG